MVLRSGLLVRKKYGIGRNVRIAREVRTAKKARTARIIRVLRNVRMVGMPKIFRMVRNSMKLRIEAS